MNLRTKKVDDFLKKYGFTNGKEIYEKYEEVKIDVFTDQNTNLLNYNFLFYVSINLAKNYMSDISFTHIEASLGLELMEYFKSVFKNVVIEVTRFGNHKKISNEELKNLSSTIQSEEALENMIYTCLNTKLEQFNSVFEKLNNLSDLNNVLENTKNIYREILNISEEIKSNSKNIQNYEIVFKEILENINLNNEKFNVFIKNLENVVK